MHLKKKRNFRDKLEIYLVCLYLKRAKGKNTQIQLANCFAIWLYFLDTNGEFLTPKQLMSWEVMSFIWIQIFSQKEKEVYLLLENREDWTDISCVYIPVCWVLVLCALRILQCKGKHECTNIYFQSHMFNVRIDVLSEPIEYQSSK